MSIFTRLAQDLSAMMFGDPRTSDAADPYEPTIEDVLAVKEEMTQTCGFPIELIDTIIDFAEYWPHTSVSRVGSLGEYINVRSGSQQDVFLLRSYPLGYVPREDDPTRVNVSAQQYPTINPKPWSENRDFPGSTTQDLLERWSENVRCSDKSPCRKIVFTLRSHDQGWGGGSTNRGTYKGSYTWFDVGQERLSAFDDRKLPSSAVSQEEGSKTFENEDGNAENRTASNASNIQRLPHFRVPAPKEEEITGDTDLEPFVCTTRTISPLTTVGKDEDNRDRYSFDHPLMPNTQCLQRNLTAERQSKEHKITWHCNDDVDQDSVDGKQLDQTGRGIATGNGHYVRNLKLGDAVTVWGKARFLGWVNVVEEVGIEVYWAV